MRVIAGTARSMPLKTVKGMDVRPTTDKTKETLFNVLQTDVPDSRFLDLFSGSGAIGIEALSRGAASAVFVEHNRQAVACIKENLTKTKLMSQAEIMPVECQTAIRQLDDGKRHFDIVFMDPPYNKQLEKEMLIQMQHASFINEETMIIIEASLETEFDWLETYGYIATKVKKYKTNQHVFVQRVLEK